MSQFKPFLVVLLSGLFLFPGWAQELGTFEESFQTEREKEKRTTPDNGEETDEEASFFAELMARPIWYGILGGGVTSQERLHSRFKPIFFPWMRESRRATAPSEPPGGKPSILRLIHRQKSISGAPTCSTACPSPTSWR